MAMKTHLLLAVALTALPAAVLAATLTDDRYGPAAISDSAPASDGAVQTASPAASPPASGYHGRFLSWANKSAEQRTDHAALESVLAPPAAPPPIRVPARSAAPSPRLADAPASLYASPPAPPAAMVIPARRDPAPVTTAALQPPIIVAPKRAPRPVQAVAKPVSNDADQRPAVNSNRAPAPSVAVAKTSPQSNSPASIPAPQHVAVVNLPSKPSRAVPAQAPRKVAVAKVSPSAKPAVSKTDVAAPLSSVATAAPAANAPAPVKTPVVVATVSPAASKHATPSPKTKHTVAAASPMKANAKDAGAQATVSATPAQASPPVALAQAWPSASAQGPVKARFYSLHRAYGDQPDAIPMPVDRPPVLVGPGDSAPAAEASDQDSEGKSDKASPSAF
jgi:hypothetical protein